MADRGDCQLGHCVLHPVLTAFTLLSYFTVSTSMYSKRLTVGAGLGNFVLELVKDFDPEGPCVGGESGLGI